MDRIDFYTKHRCEYPSLPHHTTPYMTSACIGICTNVRTSQLGEYKYNNVNPGFTLRARKILSPHWSLKYPRCRVLVRHRPRWNCPGASPRWSSCTLEYSDCTGTVWLASFFQPWPLPLRQFYDGRSNFLNCLPWRDGELWSCGWTASEAEAATGAVKRPEISK